MGSVMGYPKKNVPSGSLIWTNATGMPKVPRMRLFDYVGRVGMLDDGVSSEINMHVTGWWFQIFFYVHPEPWGRFPFWLIFFKGVETTN